MSADGGERKCNITIELLCYGKDIVSDLRAIYLYS